MVINMRSSFKLKKISSIHLIPVSFLIAILIGTILLMLPVASATGKSTDFLTALFTATTSVCVTGLVVVDTFSHWSMAGQMIILFLVQIGGLGIITVISMVMVVAQKKFSLGDRKMLQDALNLNTDVGIVKFLIKIFKATLMVEAIGAVLYSIKFIPRFGVAKGIWVSIFNSVSAFCNAGMDVMGPDSLMVYRSSPLVMFVTMTLIVMGGLGYVVWFDVYHNVKDGIKKRFDLIQIFWRFNEHTKIVLVVTFVLIFAGAAVFFVTEYNNPTTMGHMRPGERVMNSLFESITLRTAGFTTFGQENLTGMSCIFAYVLMFIGGSPVGTAGGIKTVTFFLAFFSVVSYIREEEGTVVFNRRVTEDAMRKATVIVAVSSFTVLVLTLLLIAANPMPVADALFEIISGSATVGLTRGMTGTLNSLGRVVVICAMYLGRIGPISMAIFFANRRSKKGANRYVEGKFYVG